MNKMKIRFTRYLRRQGSKGNLYITIPLTEERKNNVTEGDLVEVQLKVIPTNKEDDFVNAAKEESDE